MNVKYEFLLIFMTGGCTKFYVFLCLFGELNVHYN